MAPFLLFVCSSDYSIHDFGDLTFHYPEKDDSYMNVQLPRTVGAANKKLCGAVSRLVGAGHTLVMLGGDHRWDNWYKMFSMLKPALKYEAHPIQ